MAGRGSLFTFHGAFSDKDKAQRKEKKVKDSFIRPVRIKGKHRWLVMKAIKRRRKR